MEFICIIVAIIIISIILAIVFKINTKEAKQIAENKELNELAKKYPSNLQICKDILKKLNNQNVIIEEDKNARDCLYIAVFNKIIIAGTQTNFTRIQTIAHECIHSIQDKRIQLFNFVYSNIYLLYFIVVLVLGALNKLPNEMLFLNIYILLGTVYFVVRAYLENDAMIKARYLAKEYMEEQGICTTEETNKLVRAFDEINNIGIKGSNYTLILGVLAKVAILAIIFALF